MFDTLTSHFSNALKSITGKSKITETNIEDTLIEVRKALLEADVNFKVAKDFIAKVKTKALGEKVLKGINPREQFIKILNDELVMLMGDPNSTLEWNNRQKPLVLLLVGPNGVGKTTFCGKLALHLKKKFNKSSLLVPADTFRPAAKDQLLTHGKNIQVDCFDSDLSMPPETIAKLAIAHAKANHKDVVIIDTAGRLEVNEELMAQIQRVKQTIKDFDHEILLVVDAMTGQQAVNVAQTFHEQIHLTGVILSKMDSDARGGAALSIRSVVDVPIRFIGVGEKMTDLEIFHPDRMAQRILDMGDVMTLVEKAQEAIDKNKTESMLNNLVNRKFTLNDFIEQLDSLKRMGPLAGLMKMIPGMGGMFGDLGKNINDTNMDDAQDQISRFRVIISSMTPQERENDQLLSNESRKKRIAKGSGMSLNDINEFMSKFHQIRKMMIQMTSMLPGMASGKFGMDKMGSMPTSDKKKSGPWGKGFF